MSTDSNGVEQKISLPLLSQVITFHEKSPFLTRGKRLSVSILRKCVKIPKEKYIANGAVWHIKPD